MSTRKYPHLPCFTGLLACLFGIALVALPAMALMAGLHVPSIPPHYRLG